MENYGRELRMEIDIRRKGKIEKAIELTKRIRKVQEEPEMVLRKIQKEMKQQTDRERREVEEWKKGNRVILSMKDLVFKKWLAKKLAD